MVAYRVLALTAVAVVALSHAASAADLLPPPPLLEAPPVVSPDLGGWYLRGDVGVGVNSTSSFSTDSVISTGYSNEYYNNSISESAMIDAGVGYQVNSWFHGDVTGELRGGSSFTGLQVSNGQSAAAIGQGGAYQYADFYRGNISSAIVMANAYFDLGTWYGLSPYVGAGVGVAFNKFSGGTDTGVNTLLINNGPVTSPSGGILPGMTTANLAWALMAGVDMNITHNLKLELGYRYLNYGNFKSGVAKCLGGNVNINGAFNCGATSYSLTGHNLASNDFRVGLRYFFDAPSPEPAPLVRKY